MFEQILNGFSVALTPENLIFVFIGVLAGTIIGILPGLGPMSAIALMIPVAYTLDPTGAIIMLAGVYYGAAITEALGTEGDEVFVIGAGNSAGQAAMYFSRYARSVTILVRAASLRLGMSSYLVDQIEGKDTIRVWPHTEIVECYGESHLEGLRIKHRDSGEEERISASSVFVFIGANPHTDWLKDVVALDPAGFVLTAGDGIARSNARQGWNLKRAPFPLETRVPGIFVAGDVRHRSMRRIAGAAGEGAMAVHFVHQYLSTLSPTVTSAAAVTGRG
jgi:thioredoxin reductase (NADPH)